MFEVPPLCVTQTAPTVTVVVNPRANQGTAQQQWTSIAARLRQCFPTLQVRTTARAGQAKTLTREALEAGASMVIAFGGDGTINETLNGFVDQAGDNRFPDAVLGILAAGSGSDFQRVFGQLPLHAQLDAFISASVRRVDYGVARFQNELNHPELRAFLNIASTGISGEVLHNLSQQNSNASAQARYLRATLSAIVNQRNHQVEVRLDERAEDSKKLDLTLAAIANGRFFGSGMEISPHSSIDNGQLRVLTASVPNRRRLLALLAKVYKGKHLSSKAVEYRPARSAELRSIDPQRKVRLELDGEIVGHLPARFSVRERALRIRIASSN